MLLASTGFSILSTTPPADTGLAAIIALQLMI